MMGLINNLLLGLVEQHKGVEGRELVLSKAGLAHKSFQSEVNYPEEEFQKLLGATLEVLGVDPETAQKVFARYAGQALTSRFGAFWRTAGNARSLLTKIPKIHRDLPASVSDRPPEKVRVHDVDAQTICMVYDSPNHLCGLLRELAQFVLEYYGENGEIAEPRCFHRGDSHCEVTVRFLGKA